jgi:hypothetical protein
LRPVDVSTNSDADGYTYCNTFAAAAVPVRVRRDHSLEPELRQRDTADSAFWMAGDECNQSRRNFLANLEYGRAVAACRFAAKCRMGQ